MGKADTLSRCTDHKEGIEHDNENVVLLKPKFFKVHALRQDHLLIEGHEESILMKIRKFKDLDKSVVKAVEELKKLSTKQLLSEEWSEEQGQWKTLELVTRNYWWPGITMQVKNYVSGCNCCQRMKSFPEKPAGKLKPNEAASQPWKDITTDFITGLPEAQGYVAIIQNRNISFLHLQPLQPEV